MRKRAHNAIWGYSFLTVTFIISGATYVNFFVYMLQNFICCFYIFLLKYNICESLHGVL